MTSNPVGPGQQDRPAERRGPVPEWLRWSVLGTLFLAGFALAAPRAAPVAPAVVAACPAAPALDSAGPEGLVLPPGHPPIDGAWSRGRALPGLPPGHPPVGRVHGLPGAMGPPPLPVFAAPGSVDL